MLSVSSRATMAGLEKRGVQFVQDNGIDLRRRPPEPVRVVHAPDPRLAEYKRIADEAIERANRMAVQLHAMERQIDGIPTLRIPFARIERRICRVLRVTVHEIHSQRRVREIVFARQAVMYWAIRLTLKSYPEIGKRLGDRDHTTVLHGVKAYREKRAKMGRHLKPAR